MSGKTISYQGCSHCSHACISKVRTICLIVCWCCIACTQYLLASHDSYLDVMSDLCALSAKAFGFTILSESCHLAQHTTLCISDMSHCPVFVFSTNHVTVFWVCLLISIPNYSVRVFLVSYSTLFGVPIFVYFTALFWVLVHAQCTTLFCGLFWYKYSSPSPAFQLQDNRTIMCRNHIVK